MLMPFVRLIAIYAIIILALVAFFKRDKIVAEMSPEAEIAEVEQQAQPTDYTPIAPSNQPTVAEPIPEPAAATAPQLQTPVAPVQQPVAQVPPAATEPVSIEAQLETARAAYWDRDVTKALELYKIMLREAPDNIDVNGELGNIYYNQRQFDEAAERFFKVGLLAHESGDNQQLNAMIGVLQSFAPSMANELRNK